VASTTPAPVSNRAAGGALAALCVLAFCVLLTALSRGMGETFGVFLLPLSAEFGWERAQVTSVYSVYMVCLGLGSLVSGLAFDRFGARVSYTCGVALLIGAYASAGHLSELWHFYLCIGLLGGVGAAMVGIVPMQSLVSRWFDRRLGTALSVAYAAQGLGALMMVPAAQLAIDHFGWADAYGLSGWMFAAVLLLVLFMPWRRIAEGAVDNPRKARGGKATGGLNLRQALRTRAFWGFFFIFAFTAIGIFGISLQSVAYLVDRGFSEVEAALAFGIVGMLSFAGMTLTGLAADYWPRHIVSTCSYLLSFIGIAALALLQWFPNWFIVGIYVIAFGLSAGARGPIITTLMAEIFAGRGLASIYGASNLGQGLGAALGAFGAGLLFDLTGGYNVGFLVCSVFTFLGALLFWVVPEIRYGRRAG
jgi:MFS family permease